jgi:GNAT superfamily N-acetyltransferase
MVNALISISTAEGGPVLILEDVIVAAGHRGGGLGRHLVKHVLAWAAAEGMSRVTLLADRENESALRFYRTLGFEESAMVVRRRKL